MREEHINNSHLLRERAESFIRKTRRDIEETPLEDLQRLVYELQVYQIELEMQNEELRITQHELERTRDRYADLYDFAPLGYVTLNHQGVIVEANLAAAALLGKERCKLLQTNLYSLIPSEERLNLMHHLTAAFKEEEQCSCEISFVRNSEQLWLRFESSCSNFGLCRTIISNITEQRRSKEHSDMLMAELDHRVKNILGIVQSIAQQTIKRSSSLEAFKKSFEPRLKTLAQMQHLLTQNRWSGVSLQEIVKTTTGPYCSNTGPFIEIQGEDVFLTPSITQSFFLALHELSTNAAKYGALSTSHGKLNVSWNVTDNKLQFLWIESGGPPVQPVRTSGFGMKLLELSVQYNLGGRVRQDFRPEGLWCEIIVPLSNRIAFGPGKQYTDTSGVKH